MKKMQKKAVAILLMSSIAFLVAIVTFAAITSKIKPGPKVSYLGEISTEIFDYYGQGEQMMAYLDEGVKFAAKRVTIPSGSTGEQYKERFKKEFIPYVNQFNAIFYKGKKENLTINDYEISLIGKELILKSKKKLPVYALEIPSGIQKQAIYTITPSLKVKVNFETKETSVKPKKKSKPSQPTVPLR